MSFNVDPFTAVQAARLTPVKFRNNRVHCRTGSLEIREIGSFMLYKRSLPYRQLRKTSLAGSFAGALFTAVQAAEKKIPRPLMSEFVHCRTGSLALQVAATRSMSVHCRTGSQKEPGDSPAALCEFTAVQAA